MSPEIRTLVTLSLLFCAVGAFRLSDLRPFERLNASPRNSCVGVPNGSQLPHPVNCNQFILCENDMALTLTCRTSAPHFDRCNGRCVDDLSVCMITNCNGAPTTPTTQPPVDTPPTTTTTSLIVPTVGPEETSPPTDEPIEPDTTTTTRFVVPTVPS